MINECKKLAVNEIYNIFLEEFYKDELLVNHRTHIEKNGLGYGEKAFHVFWREIIKSMPSDFNFIEIGVYKGQVLSLVKMLSDKYDKNISYFGVTPLTNADDKYSNYEDVNYSLIITDLFKHFNLDFNLDTNIINGYSNEQVIKDKIKSIGKFDLIYIDGGHDYDCVVSDILLTKDISKIGTLVVFDDCSCFKGLRGDLFSGHEDVCNAVRDYIESDMDFEEIICVGHNRLFKKVN